MHGEKRSGGEQTQIVQSGIYVTVFCNVVRKKLVKSKGDAKAQKIAPPEADKEYTCSTFGKAIETEK